MAETDCAASTHEFKLHDWRWLGWPLSNPSSPGRWCRLCGLVQGEPDGQCQTGACLEYAAGGNDYCEACQQNRTITAARSDLARKVLEVVEAKRDEYRHECDEAAKIDGGDHPNLWAARARAMSHMADLLRELFAKEGIDVNSER